MTQEEKEIIQTITNKITKKQTAELLTTSFELDEIPSVIAINRGKTSVKGFILIHKKILEFVIIFLKQENKIKMVIDLYFGKHALVKTEEITISKTENGIDIFTTNNRQYLFSIYF